MNSGVIDNFLGILTQYIDSGFGLLGPEVNFLARTLVLIDIILAALFWSWAGDEDIIARLIKKTLFVGVFAYLIGNWQMLSKAVFESFAALGLKASGTGLSEADFLRPGRVAQVGLDAGQPILQSISGLMGFVSFFENFIQITVLLFAWAIVLISFFVLAIQLFVSLIEFKLSTLCGFVLIPFGLFGKTAFAAERVLGTVISSGVKVLVLAVIVGIGSTLFSTFTTNSPATPTISDAMGLVLASLSLLGLGIFGPGIANGIVSGGPQLGAGAAIGGLALGLVWQSARGTVTPWVVQIDRLGQAQALAPADADYQPTDGQIAWHLARFIEELRGVPADPIVVRQNWLRAYDFTTDKGALALNGYAQAFDPFGKVGKVQVSVEIASVIRASPDSFRVAWVERRYENGSLSATERWTAILTTVLQTPHDAEKLRKNPLGIYVAAINWSKELGQ